MRRMDRHTNDLNLMMWGESWRINSFKEYVAKVRKTERTVLTPRRYTIDSDLDPLVEDLKREKIAILRKAFSFSDKTHEQIKLAKKKTDEEVLRMGERATKLSYLGNEQKSERWEALLKEIETKKSVLNVEGRTPEQRAEEFAKLNYLLSFSSDEMSLDSCSIPDKNAAPKKRKSKSKSNPDRERLLRLAEAEAEAIFIMLELESLNN